MQAMRTVVATALILLLVVFLGPMLFLGGPPEDPEEDPLPTATLPIDRTAITPGSDASRLVRVGPERVSSREVGLLLAEDFEAPVCESRPERRTIGFA